MKKKNRVKKSYEFQQIIETGAKETNASFVLYYTPKQQEEARIGITLSKKIGNAVMRNHFKRQIRMMCQECIDIKTYPFDIILVARFRYKEFSYLENKNHLEKLLLKATIE